MKPGLNFILLDVFSETPFDGNQLAVFPDAAGLDRDVMAAIATELKTNETVFVTGSEDNAFSARIFSPHGELAFAGHPAVGAAAVIAGRLPAGSDRTEFSLCLPAGPVRVCAQPGRTEGLVMIESPRLPVRIEHSLSRGEAASLLGLQPEQIAAVPVHAAAYTTGLPFFCIRLSGRQAVADAALDKEIWTRLLADSSAPHVYIFATHEPGRIAARMFAPLAGVEEDPATGAAAVALAGYLSDHTRLPEGMIRFHISQGNPAGRSGCIELELTISDGLLQKVRIGGHCSLIGTGSLSAVLSDLQNMEPSGPQGQPERAGSG